MRSASSRALRALPTLLRIGVAETVAYRAELLFWILNTTMPLVMLGLWTGVANEAPFQDFTSADFVAYYLSGMIVRNSTESWVSWQIADEIRTGKLSMRLLRPIHPLITTALMHLAAVPLRSLTALPIALVLLLSSGASSLATEPIQFALLVPSLFLAWLISFSLLFAVGCCGFWITQTLGIANLYFGIWSLLSGFLLPLALLPGWFERTAGYLPFYGTLGAPIELMTRSLTADQLTSLLARQLFWGVAAVSIALAVWRAGVRRFEAVGV